jgi:hypothetical protein
MKRLVFYMNRYGAELEADFLSKYNGLDLGALWRARLFKRILRLIDQLPRNTRYAHAVANDPEHVEAILKATGGQPGKAKGPSIADFTLESELLMEIFDAVQQNTNAVLAAGGAKNLPKLKPRRRPDTVHEDVSIRQAQSAHAKLVKKIFGGRPGPKVDP